MKKLTLPLMTLVACATLTTSAYADISIEFKNGNQHKITDKYLKSIEEKGAVVSIDNFKEKTMKVLNESDKTYLQMSYQEMCDTSEIVQETVADSVSNMLEHLPTEQREMMAGLLAQAQSSAETKDTVEIINLGASETIAGYKTNKYQVVVNEEVKEIIWLTADKELSKEMKPLFDRVAQFTCGDGEDDYQDSTPYMALIQKGYPLKTYLNDAAFDESNNSFSENAYNEEDIEEVRAINFDEIAHDEFIVPADYQKTTLAEQMKKLATSMQY
jgi:hypothetical protein